jgi:signal transduction histidine kinase
MVLNLESIKPFPYTPNVELTEIMVNTKPYREVGLDIAGITKLNLKYDENSLNIKLFALSQYNGNLNTIKYRLLGYDSTWNTVASGDEISLYTLPGVYTLEIVGVNANGLEGEKKRINIYVDTPFWQELWFKSLAILLLGGVVKLIHWNWRLRKEKKEIERQTAIQGALQKERKRIGDDMHEELGGELTAIQLITKKVSREVLSSADSKRLLQIEKHAQDSVTNIREIIWAMDDEYDNLPDLAIYLRRFVVEYLDKLGIKCKTDIALLPDRRIGGTLRSNVFRCVKEVVHNIVKHAKAREAHFSIAFDEETNLLLIRIKDDGQGLPSEENEEKHFGNGLKSMKRRMADINGSISFINENGLCVQLSVPLEPNTKPI